MDPQLLDIIKQQQALIESLLATIERAAGAQPATDSDDDDDDDDDDDEDDEDDDEDDNDGD